MLSVVICTRNRAAGLTRCLERWAALGDPDLEMVLVDDGSTDGTAGVIATAAAAFAGPLRTSRTTGLGLGAARNVGWRMASGDPILFTDDDCYPAPDLPAALRAAFGSADLGFQGGQLLPATAAHAEVAVVTRSHPVAVTGPAFVPAGLIPGANMAIRRTALETVGGFDPEFGAGTRFPAEDVELIARLAAAGFRGRFDPSARVIHDHDRLTPASQRALRRQYSRGRGAYYAKCLLDPRLRGAYLRAWLRTAPRSLRQTAAEVDGALAYWFRRRHP